MIRVVVLLLAALFAASPLRAADAWSGAAVKTGAKLIVMDANGRVHKGRLLEWAPQTVAVQTAAERLDLARESVALIRAPGPFGNLQTIYAPWENLAQIPAGREIRVLRTTALQVNGAFEQCTDEGISLTRRNRTVFIRRSDISKVRIQVKSNADAGLKVGAATGVVAALFVLVAAATQGASSDGADGLLELAAAGGGEAGKALGSLFDEYQTIYVSPRR